jgi:hypothetical protein
MDTRKPLVQWEDDQSGHVDLVWGSRLDKRYQIEVQRTGYYTGQLCIFDHQEDDRLLHEEPVFLSFGALFGPDVSDVLVWQELAVTLIDKSAN